MWTSILGPHHPHSCAKQWALPLSHALFSCPLFDQVKCYHKKFRSATRDVIFRLQFHTGAVQGYGLLFGKEELDSACKGVWMKPFGMSEAVSFPVFFPTCWQRDCQRKKNGVDLWINNSEKPGRGWRSVCAALAGLAGRLGCLQCDVFIFQMTVFLTTARLNWSFQPHRRRFKVGCWQDTARL